MIKQPQEPDIFIQHADERIDLYIASNISHTSQR